MFSNCSGAGVPAEQPMKKQLDGSSSHFDQETWRQILTAAKELFFAKGYKGVSMKEIADAVQVTPAALYYHFPKGKEDLFTKMIQTLFVEEGVAGLDQVLETTPDLRERLNLFTAFLLMIPIDEQLTMLLRDAREHIKDPESQRIILSLRDRIKQQVMGLFQAARDAGGSRRASRGRVRRRTRSPCCLTALRLPHNDTSPDSFHALRRGRKEMLHVMKRCLSFLPYKRRAHGGDHDPLP